MIGVAFAMGGAPGAEAGQAAGPMGAFGQILPLVFMFVIFYFLLIRPQQKKAKEHKALIDALQKGQNVVTAGGVHGKVVSLDDNLVTLEIAPNVNIKIIRSYIASVQK